MRQAFSELLLTMLLLLGALTGTLTGEALARDTQLPLPTLLQPRPFLGFGDSLGISPYWDWQTLETSHFRVTFPKELEEIARRAALHLEDAHVVLTRDLRWTPRFKTQVLVIDNSDFANGLASPVSRFGIVLYTTPPENWFSIGYYDDWLRMLAIHEYSHILNMDPTRGLWDPLRYVFGDLLLPNSLWAPWMLEGLAVYFETQKTRAGRGRSPFYEMLLRTAVEQGKLGKSEFVALDEIQGPNPYYPGGETAYAFGYHLMNQVEKTGRKQGYDPEQTLGLLSERSSHRVPFFINGLLGGVVDRSWDDLWTEWVSTSESRLEADLQAIRKLPVSRIDFIERSQFGALGSASSPDGKWLAFTMDQPNDRVGLYLKNIDPQTIPNSPESELVRVADKVFGVGLSFTPDSKYLIGSSVERFRTFYQFSDLVAYEVGSLKVQQLTHGARLKDPDVSHDGKWIVGTQAHQNGNRLVRLPLIREFQGDREVLRVGEIEVLWSGKMGDRVSTPKWTHQALSPASVIFSFQKNGELGEALMEYQLKEKSLRTLVQDGSFNRFPTVTAKGEILYVSDRSGVDNLYRYSSKGSVPLSNVTTGLWLPSSGPQGVYASVFTLEGWKVGRVDIPLVNPWQNGLPRVQPIEAPKSVSVPSNRETQEEVKNTPTESYSIFPSIFPRQWAPLWFADQSGQLFGGQVLGYDATDRHRYVLLGAYNTRLESFEYFANYDNRMLGPTVSLQTSRQTLSQQYFAPSDTLDFTTKQTFSAQTFFPFRWTWSQWTPVLGVNAERENRFLRQGDRESLIGSAFYVPSLDFSFRYSDVVLSRLAIAPEGGRQVFLGVRGYDRSGTQTAKTVLNFREHLGLGDHWVLTPAVKGAYASRTDSQFLSSNVSVSGRLNRIFNPIAADNFDQISLRGYPRRLFLTRFASVGSLDLQMPLWRIFRGWNLNPIFAENLHGVVFGESAYFPNATTARRFLPSYGAGIRLDLLAFLHLPITLSVDYQVGTETDRGGTSEAFFGLNLGALSL